MIFSTNITRDILKLSQILRITILKYHLVFRPIILLHKKFLQFDWLRAVVFQLNVINLHVEITNLLHVVV